MKNLLFSFLFLTLTLPSLLSATVRKYNTTSKRMNGVVNVHFVPVSITKKKCNLRIRKLVHFSYRI